MSTAVKWTVGICYKNNRESILRFKKDTYKTTVRYTKPFGLLAEHPPGIFMVFINMPIIIIIMIIFIIIIIIIIITIIIIIIIIVVVVVVV